MKQKINSAVTQVNNVGNIYVILLVLFSIATALGSFNPFGGRDIDSYGNSSSPLTLVIQGIFILSLFFIKGYVRFLRTEYKFLCIFSFVWILSSIFFEYSEISFNLILNIVKLILCIVLFYHLPQLFIHSPRLLIWSIVSFSLTCSLIALAFSIGLLDSYVIWSNGRVFIFNENPNSTSTRMVFSCVIIVYLVFQNPLGWSKQRFLLLPLLFPLLFCIMASGSRGSFIVLFSCLAMYIILAPTNRPFLKFMSIGISVIFIGCAIVKISKSEDFSMLERLSESIDHNSDGGRTKLSSAALNIFMDNPIIGTGSVGFTKIMKEEYGLDRTVHNLYWYIAATSGIVGFLSFMAFILCMLKRAWHVRRKDPLSIVLLFGMLLIASKTGGALTYMTMWYMFSISMSLTKSLIIK